MAVRHRIIFGLRRLVGHPVCAGSVGFAMQGRRQRRSAAARGAGAGGRARQAAAALVASLLLTTGTALPVGATGSTPGVQATPPAPATTALCGSAAPGYASCMSLRRADIAPLAAALVTPLSTPSGYGPSDLQSAYALTAAAATRGAGQTVAVVDAYDLPTAEADLATYRSQFGLPACTTANGCFRKVDQNGGTNYPSADTGWGGEIALDIDMVSAICPKCKILLVEASSASISNLGTAVNEAADARRCRDIEQLPGLRVLGRERVRHRLYNHPGIAVTASSGDSGYGVGYPASSPYVVAVGGTSLATASNPRGWTETAWSGAGSGCSAYDRSRRGSTMRAARGGRSLTSPQLPTQVPALPSSRPASTGGWYSVVQASPRRSSRRRTPLPGRRRPAHTRGASSMGQAQPL